MSRIGSSSSAVPVNNTGSRRPAHEYRSTGVHWKRRSPIEVYRVVRTEAEWSWTKFFKMSDNGATPCEEHSSTSCIAYQDRNNMRTQVFLLDDTVVTLIPSTRIAVCLWVKRGTTAWMTVCSPRYPTAVDWERARSITNWAPCLTTFGHASFTAKFTNPNHTSSIGGLIFVVVFLRIASTTSIHTCRISSVGSTGNRCRHLSTTFPFGSLTLAT